MKALSVKQPWASFIATGEKTVECRSWPTKYRGQLIICSSKGDDFLDYTDRGLEEDVLLPGGMALGVVELVDCQRMRKEDIYNAVLPEGMEEEVLKGYAWHLKRLYEIVPVPVKGRLGLYNLDIPLEKLPEEFEDHIIYLDFKKYGRFRLSEW